MNKVELAYIIDDDEIIIYLTDKLLKKVDFANKVETFFDAESALKALNFAKQQGENIPDVILFDLNMPVMNGWDFIEEFQKLKLDIPCFVFTSSIDPSDKQRSYQYTEIRDFITKPLTVQKLDKILRLLDE
jgi:CheY-like chemotaxis protein